MLPKRMRESVVLRSHTMQNELERFLAHPTARHYLRVRKLILQDAQLRPRTADLVRLHQLFEAGQFQQVLDAAERMLPAWALSPRLYWLTAFAAQELGHTDDAELDRFLYQSCLAGITATGDGSRQAPYVITYLSDEAEWLQWSGRRAQQRGLVRIARGYCDCVQCQDGSEVFFLLDSSLVEPDQRDALVEYASPRRTARSSSR